MAITLALVCLAGGSLATGLLSYGTSKGGTVTISEEEYALLEKYKRLEEIYKVIDALYLWEYDDAALMEGAAQGMLGALGDDYTFYYTPEQMEKENETITGEYGGLGFEVSPNLTDDTITIRRVFHGGPAQQAGIRTGDKIIAVNGEEMRALDINDAVAIMRGEVGVEVTLTILRDQEIFDVTMERAIVQTEIIKYEMLDENIGYMRVYYFEGNMMGQIDEAKKAFDEAGAKGLILDLRDNPGGLVNLAIDLVDMFVGEEPILHTQDKYGRNLSYYGREGQWDIPVVILTNGYSASASEIVAAALQEYGVAKIVGEQSFGKGIMQSVYPFATDGAGMQITSDYWLTPQKNNLHEEGVTPDVEVVLDEDVLDDTYQIIREKDNQLAAGIEVLKEMIK